MAARLTALVCVIALAAACGGTLHVRKLGVGGKSEEASVRFHRPKPYVMLSSGELGCEARIVFLPDPNETFEVSVSGGLTPNVSIALQDGWNLVGISGDVAAANTAAPASAPVMIAEGIAGFDTLPLHVGLYELDLSKNAPRKIIWDSGIECGPIE